ncbi:hypothetical protein ACE1B6_20885 [Aerosakkonemataceae cyanobacterium BLCC-F154]|uniref:ATP synthase F0 subunit 8 n=1 Tax=Floridaenema fluviatile BLCC-F154 TaxID=3153640 RepID=A0ABV4YFX2_9CYAN
MAFLLLGKGFLWSFGLAFVAGIATGWIITGWQSQELPDPQKIPPELTGTEEEKEKNKKENKFKKRRPKRYRRQPQKSWFFWKNPRRPPKKRR